MNGIIAKRHLNSYFHCCLISYKCTMYWSAACANKAMPFIHVRFIVRYNIYYLRHRERAGNTALPVPDQSAVSIYQNIDDSQSDLNRFQRPPVPCDVLQPISVAGGRDFAQLTHLQLQTEMESQ